MTDPGRFFVTTPPGAMVLLERLTRTACLGSCSRARGDLRQSEYTPIDEDQSQGADNTYGYSKLPSRARSTG